MMQSYRLLFFFWLFSSQILANDVDKVVLLGTTAQLKAQLEHASKLGKDVEFLYFSVDEASNIFRHFEALFPKELNKEPEHIKNQYLETHINPTMKAYAPEIMRSEMGLSLAKLYRLERVPAVVINDKYITYGLTVNESLRAFLSVK